MDDGGPFLFPSLGLIVHHTDADQEYAYDSAPKSSGRLIEALQEAPERGWVVVDIAEGPGIVYGANRHPLRPRHDYVTPPGWSRILQAAE